jgi:hypothetical protein
MNFEEYKIKLSEELVEFYDKPYEFVMWAFPWGEPGTILEDFDGPREWQKEYLIKLGELIRERGFDFKEPVPPIQVSVASGHGIGKSALVAWLILFIMSTRPHCKGVVTATTAPQLRTKTWSELGKWYKMCMTKDFFEYRNSQANLSMFSKEHSETWRVDGITCKEENSEAFAGQHINTSTSFYIFDEASGVPDKIYEVAQGGLTDGEPWMLLFGNPTKNTGYFRTTFGRNAHRWVTRQIDSRTVEGTNKKLFQTWAEDYGEDSDFFRVRVRGVFPRAAVCQLIPSDLVHEAMGKHLKRHVFSSSPVVLGVDVAWYGDDRSCIWLRQGLAATLLWVGREVDSIDLAGMVARYERKYRAEAVFVDAGYGNGVIDQLRRLGHNPTPVWFGGKSGRGDCKNKRAEMWANMRDWLRMGPAIPKDVDLETDLTGVEYSSTLNGQIILEPKEAMKKRGLASPDLGDGLALTFAMPVQRTSREERMLGEFRKLKGKKSDANMCETEYNVLDMAA